MAQRIVRSTKDYSLFTSNDMNRTVHMEKHKRLRESMKRYGFIPSFPISVIRKGAKLIVQDGQHRLAFAMELGLPVHFVEVEIDFDIGEVNSSAVPWKIRDYAEKFAKQGIKSYEELLEFVDGKGVPICLSAALLAGHVTFCVVKQKFIDGKFVVKDREHAEMVAGLYVELRKINPEITGARGIEACVAVCRVPEFKASRLIANAKAATDKLVQCSTRDGMLEVFETLYNYRVKGELFPLRIKAMSVMRARNPKNRGIQE